MSTPTGENAFLHELEVNVRTELTLAEIAPPAAIASVGIPSRSLGTWQVSEPESFSGGQPGDVGPVEAEQQAIRRTGGGVRGVLPGREVLQLGSQGAGLLR